MLWACIALPALSLDVALRTQPDPARPVALIDGPATCRSLLAVNAAAARLGLRAGQKLTLARAIHADFSALPFDAVATARWQQWLAAWAYRFSHQVSVAWPHSIVLEVGHSLQLMGGWPAFEARLRDELGQLQFQHRIGLAPSPRAAHLLAWLKDGVQAHTPAQQQALLARVPVRRAGLPGQAGERLHRLGL
ncbi:MAG: DNA polymerase Y family protein, partial [Lautropia sp.]